MPFAGCKMVSASCGRRTNMQSMAWILAHERLSNMPGTSGASNGSNRPVAENAVPRAKPAEDS